MKIERSSNSSCTLLTADLPDILHPREIIGNGHSIDGGNEVFSDHATSISELAFTGITITNASLGIVTSYTSSVTITGSSANGNDRNGFYIFVVINSTLNMSGSSVGGNSRNGFQVTADLDSAATITDVAAAGNVNSGLLAAVELRATTSVSDSTFSGASDGAGVSIVNWDVDPAEADATSLEITVRGSTISSNFTGGEAGGILAILHGDSSLSSSTRQCQEMSSEERWQL